MAEPAVSNLTPLRSRKAPRAGTASWLSHQYETAMGNPKKSGQAAVIVAKRKKKEEEKKGKAPPLWCLLQRAPSDLCAGDACPRQSKPHIAEQPTYCHRDVALFASSRDAARRMNSRQASPFIDGKAMFRSR